MLHIHETAFTSKSTLLDLSLAAAIAKTDGMSLNYDLHAVRPFCGENIRGLSGPQAQNASALARPYMEWVHPNRPRRTRLIMVDDGAGAKWLRHKKIVEIS